MGDESSTKSTNSLTRSDFKITFWRAPWRKKDYKFRSPIHFYVLGLACCTYLFLVGKSLTYLAFVKEAGYY